VLNVSTVPRLFARRPAHFDTASEEPDRSLAVPSGTALSERVALDVRSEIYARGALMYSNHDGAARLLAFADATALHEARAALPVVAGRQAS
jgi:hypothetical protein